jgi:hypothetical protein
MTWGVSGVKWGEMPGARGGVRAERIGSRCLGMNPSQTYANLGWLWEGEGRKIAKIAGNARIEKLKINPLPLMNTDWTDSRIW